MSPLPSPNLQIDKALESDIPELVALLSQLTQTSVEEALPAFRRMSEYPNYNVYLVRDAQKIIGTFALLVLDNMGHNGCHVGIVENVVVDQERRGQGIGKYMMHFAKSIALEHRCYKLILASNVRLEEAHRFYESLGFQKQGYAFSLDL